MVFTRKTELRHIPPAEINKIALLLNSQSAWKKLMLRVPLTLTPDNWEDDTLRYTTDHIGSIERRYDKLPSEIFLEEWATSGRIRPTLGHLLQLLIRCELFRAADHVAVNLLNESPPKRPHRGPAARVDNDLTLLEQNNTISQQLLGMDDPRTSQLINSNTGPNSNKDFFIKRNLEGVVKVDDVMNFSSVSEISTNHQQSRLGLTGNNASASTSLGLRNIPSTSRGPNNISAALDGPNGTASLPNFEYLINNQSSQPDLSSTTSSLTLDNGIPDIFILGYNQLNHHDIMTDVSSNIPLLSQLNLQNGEHDSMDSIAAEVSAGIPQLSALIMKSIT